MNRNACGLLGAVLVATLASWPSGSAQAAEGTSVAGPIGGTDLRSALLPPPGLYGGLLHFYAEAWGLRDGKGNTVPGTDPLALRKGRTGPFFLYVPETRVLGGTLGFLAAIPAGYDCGRVTDATPSRCVAGVGDPYLEVAWSHFFGTVRPSRYEDAFPIAEGLAVTAGLGVVVPIGRYSTRDVAQGLILGNNIWDLAPSLALTYTTRPLIFEGTELSAKVYWNSYLENPATDYRTGALINIDFALTERIGRWQAGLAGFYAFQVADDKVNGLAVPPDGRRIKALSLGGVIAYDMPEYGASLKIKALTSVKTRNGVDNAGILVGWIKKFQ